MPKLTLKKTTEGNNNQAINETTTNEINQIVESMLDMIKRGQKQPPARANIAQVQKSASKKGIGPPPGGPVIIPRADFQKAYNDLKNIQTAMKSVDTLARNLSAMSKKNKALLPLTESTVAITGKVMTAMVALVKQIATSIRPADK